MSAEILTSVNLEIPDGQAEDVEEAAQDTQELDVEDSGRDFGEEQGAHKQDVSEAGNQIGEYDNKG
ncbi:hypothetical protein KI688_004039 [Linnemannia hyalina]|uniref:Uncharacterized protein n=1 Tax=Linnemannia hyalina TaxID=64524 RepID=A0A9P8BQ25_9FUNG|nr:hypothetical protein KI688_004039 [Linnemannia hyalina]